MKNKIGWQNSVVELIVVFIGITAAFLLNNWRESSEDSQLERKYVNTILDESQRDSEELQSNIESQQQKFNKIQNYLHQLQSGKASVDTAASLLADMLSINPFYPRSSAYESLKFSGHLNLLKNYEAREQIVRYYESFTESKLQEQISINFIYDYIAKFAFDNIDLVRNTLIDKGHVDRQRLNNLVIGYFAFLRQNLRNQKSIYENNMTLQETLKNYYR